jgi:hypothetical protein
MRLIAGADLYHTRCTEATHKNPHALFSHYLPYIPRLTSLVYTSWASVLESGASPVRSKILSGSSPCLYARTIHVYGGRTSTLVQPPSSIHTLSLRGADNPSSQNQFSSCGRMGL